MVYPHQVMLGGGNPAQIPEMKNYFQSLLANQHWKAADAALITPMTVHKLKTEHHL